MKMNSVYRKVQNNPINKKKRILRTIEPAITLSSQPPHNYRVTFSVDGLRVYASVSPILELNECIIFPVTDDGVFFGMELYTVRGVSVTKEGLLSCIDDWLDTILVKRDGYFYEAYLMARNNFSCDCKTILVEGSN